MTFRAAFLLIPAIWRVPLLELTRAEAAAIVQRLLQKAGLIRVL